MLKTSKSISLTGTSMINDKPTVYMQANISTDGGTTSRSNNIQDKALYDANKTECRKDMADFEKLVYEMEDSMSAETEGE